MVCFVPSIIYIHLLVMMLIPSLFLVAEGYYFKAKRGIVFVAVRVAIVILCALLDYLIWTLLTGFINRIFTIMTFNSAVFVVYQLKGPAWVLWLLLMVGNVTEYLGSFIVTYPIPSAVVICGMFLVSLTYNCWMKLRRGFFRRHVVASAIQQVNIRLQALEDGQKEILEQIKLILERQT